MADTTGIWLPLYVGEFLSCTQAFTAEQSGAYINLLVYQWKTGLLPADVETLRRIAGVEKDAWPMVWRMMQPLFTRTVTGFLNEKLADLKSQSQQRHAESSKKAQVAAHKRWNKNAPSNAQAVHEPCPDDAPSIAQAVPQQCPLQTHSTLEEKEEETGDTPTQPVAPDGAGVVSALALLSVWNSKCPKDLRVVTLTRELKRDIEARITDGLKSDLLTQALDDIAKSPYLQCNQRNWRADFALADETQHGQRE
jgi:uncharacterized protein YdaU (DUF1376 family)